jgi:CRP-like cAMP-binding protein
MTGRSAPRLGFRSIEPVVRRLRALATLSALEEELLASLTERRIRHRAGDELIAEGQRARRPRFIVSGWAQSHRVLMDGRRQTFGFLLPGDGLGLCSRQAPPALAVVMAATALETVDAEPIMEAVQNGQAPGLERAISAAARLDDILTYDQITRLGCQTAYERVAHFLLEMQHRAQMAGLGDRQRFPMPLTQEMLADALGLSIVHINRTLQQLRQRKLIELRSGVAVLLDRDALISLADFRWPKSESKIT